MIHYRVSWEIDIEAVSAEEAARKALETQRDPASTATVFEVRMFQPCPVCKKKVVHEGDCRIATRDNVTLVRTPREIDLGARNAKKGRR